jgi:hypothetical protein
MQRKTTRAQLLKLNLLGQFLKLVRPDLIELSSHNRRKPVRSVWKTRPVLSRNSPNDPRGQTWVKQTQNSPQLGQGKPLPNKDLLTQNSSRRPTSDKIGQTGSRNRSGRFCLGNREELHPREKLDLHFNQSPESLHKFKWDFGDSRGTSWATFGKNLKPQNSPG